MFHNDASKQADEELAKEDKTQKSFNCVSFKNILKKNSAKI